MMKRKEGFSGVHYAVFALLLMLILTGSSRFTGMAVGEPPIELKNLLGYWQINEKLDISDCGDRAPELNYRILVSESGGRVNLAFPAYELITNNQERGVRDPFNISGQFTGRNISLSGNVALLDVSGGIATIDSAQLALSNDCNSVSGTIFWTWRSGRDRCSGTAEIKGFSDSGKGCFAPECKESWICPEFGACVNNTQTRECSDVNRCGTVKDKPAEKQTCASPVPVPAPKKSYLSMILFVALFLMAISAVASTAVVVNKKKKFSDQLEELVKNIRKSLFNEDLAGAINGYKVLTEQFTNSQKNLTKKDSGRIYKESLDIYADIVGLQAQKSAPVAA